MEASPRIPCFAIISVHRVYKELREAAVTGMKPEILKEKHFQMLKLGKNFTANVLKYANVISRFYYGSKVITEEHLAYVEQTEVYILN